MKAVVRGAIGLLYISLCATKGAVVPEDWKRVRMFAKIARVLVRSYPR